MFRKKQNELLRIDCNDGLRNNLLRISGLLLPAWGIIAPVAIFLFLASPGGFGPYSGWYLSFPLPFLVLPLSIACARRNLRVERTTIKFPGLNFKSYPLANLHRVEIKNSKIQFCFAKQTGKIDCDIVELPLSRITQESRLSLLRTLDNISCPIDEESRRKLLNYGIQEFDPNIDIKRILSYDSHSKLRAFREVCSHYEHVFWKTWVGCQLPIMAFITPLLLLIPYCIWLRLQGMDPSKDPLKLGSFFGAWVNFWGELFRILSQSVAQPVIHAGSFYLWLISYSFESKVLFAVAATILLLFLVSLFVKPNRIEISKKGLELQLRLAMMTFALKTLPWKNLVSTRLLRQNDKGKVTDQHIVLESNEDLTGWTGGSRAISLSNAAIVKPEDKDLLLKAIEAYAPQCEIESGIINNLIPARRHNYTELWLESLNSPPKRERLKPLTKGDYLQSGKFQVKEIIGSGGQGIAYLSSTLDKTGQAVSIVIKEFMLPVYVDRRARSQAIERFENEAQVLASLDSEQVVKLKDHFIEDHRAYLVLEHIKGVSLSKLVQERFAVDDDGIDEAKLCDLVSQMCDILVYLHNQQTALVHRDFTPDNLILDESGKLKLIDFNVVHFSGTQKSNSTIVGKHAYMPPEQFAGRPCPQSDLYAMGASIYYLLTGEHPEPFTQLSLPPSILDKRANTSRQWQEIISACTNLTVQERVQSATEVKLMVEYIPRASESIVEDPLSVSA